MSIKTGDSANHGPGTGSGYLTASVHPMEVSKVPIPEPLGRSGGS